MNEHPASEAAVVCTHPRYAAEPGFDPFGERFPDELIFCAFFRSEEARTHVVQALKQIVEDAAKLKLPDEALAPATALLRKEHGIALQLGDQAQGLLILARWWAAVQRKGYHVYRLRVGSPPYRTSLLLSFTELDAATIEWNVERALELLGDARDRLLEAFGLG